LHSTPAESNQAETLGKINNCRNGAEPLNGGLGSPITPPYYATLFVAFMINSRPPAVLAEVHVSARHQSPTRYESCKRYRSRR